MPGKGTLPMSQTPTPSATLGTTATRLRWWTAMTRISATWTPRTGARPEPTLRLKSSGRLAPACIDIAWLGFQGQGSLCPVSSKSKCSSLTASIRKASVTLACV